MAEDLTINVNINPNGQPTQTSSTPPETSPTATPVADKGLNLRNIAEIGLLANAGKQVFMSSLGRVGEITGNAQLQRNINKFTKLGGIVGSFAINPVVGGIVLVTTIGTEVVNQHLKIRDENNAAEYYRNIQGIRSNKGRIKWYTP